jgi:hypothetical protein
MGGGTWTKDAFTSYSHSMCRAVMDDGSIKGKYTAQEMFKQRSIDQALNPKNVVRECVDTEEHPNTIPVILALDVTGSMGESAVEIAKKLNVIMTKLYESVTDIEFMIMAIGDFAYDSYPLQASQFESDIRIAEQLDKVYFEAGGGGNSYESYSAAWLFGARQTKLDCWKRGKKGLIITIGDELLNPYLPGNTVNKLLLESVQTDIETSEIYNEVKEKYDVYHLNCTSTFNGNMRMTEIVKSFASVIGEQNISNVTVEEITDKIVSIVKDFAYKNPETVIGNTEVISW